MDSLLSRIWIVKLFLYLLWLARLPFVTFHGVGIPVQNAIFLSDNYIATPAYCVIYNS